MIDEELAEEYSKGLCKTCTVDTCRYNTLQTCAIKESIKQAFLAGLKAKEKENAKLKKLLHAYFMYFMSAQNGYYLKDIDEKEVKKLLGVDKIM